MEKTIPLSFHKHLSFWLCVPGKEKLIRDQPCLYGAHLLGDTDSSLIIQTSYLGVALGDCSEYMDDTLTSAWETCEVSSVWEAEGAV